ncbi:hypothetical protein BaRGS_00027514 [Batillaria attramentaria]|uniref:Uncharacterized protein n=1 Tax=Batillaria attramentaria TaxID=370345 RepID=A0ABD0K238_9CAEN
MDEVFVCGFNGFGQCDGFEVLLMPFLEDPESDAARPLDITVSDTTRYCPVNQAQLLKNSPTRKTNSDTTQKCPVNRTQQLRDGESGQTTDPQECQHRELRKRKGSNCRKDDKMTDKNMCSLRSVCTFPEKSILLKNAEITWARICVTLLKITGAECEAMTHHTFLSGYSASTDGTSPLQLHLTDTVSLGSSHGDLLLQNGRRLLMLQEKSNDPVLSSIAGNSEAKEEKPEHPVNLELVSGTASNFVTCYDGISVGTLVPENKTTSEGLTDNAMELRLVPVDSGLSVRHVSCGLEHTLLLTQHGGILSFGAGSRGQLGHGSLEGEQQPQMVAALEGLCCVSVAAGGWHSAAVSELGDLYMWGWNESGQLGLPSPGVQEDICRRGQQQQQQGDHQQTHKPASLHLWPVCVDVGFEEEDIVSVSCGTRHSAVLTCNGKAFTTGWNKYCQLGLPHPASVDHFTPVVFPSKQATVKQVWCGAWNSLFVVRNTVEEKCK